MTLMASLKLTWILRHAGKLQEIINICQQRWQVAYDNGLSKTAVVGWLLAVWGEALAEMNDLDAAKDRAERGAALTERGSDVAMISMSYVCLTRVLFSAGDLAGTQAVLDKLQRLSQKTHVPPWLTNLTGARQAQIWLAQNKLDAVSQWVQECRLDVDDDPVYQREIGHIILARLLIAQERQDEALRLLQRLLESAQACGRTSRAIEILILQALAFQNEGNIAQALTVLEKALSLAEPGGFIRIFVDEGPPMARLLYEVLSRDIAPDYVRRLLAAFPMAQSEPAAKLEKTTPFTTQAPKSDLIEPLSEREIEVLELVAEGLSNQEIASRLFLSQHTVKAHTRNIYGKLDVHSRTEAVARCRALGILSST
jgi:LuxR family maltose regulon positive regulatory protein